MRFLNLLARVLTQPIFKVLAYTVAVGLVGKVLESYGYLRLRDFEMIAILVMVIQNHFALEKITRHIDE